MTKQQKKNSLEDFYAKPARKARFLSKKDFSRTMRWTSVIGFLIGVVFAGVGALGLAKGVTTDKAPVFVFVGLFLCISALLSIAFPGFRRFFDGGTLSDIFEYEAVELAEAWAQSIPGVQTDQLSINDPLFWGSTKELSCIVLVKWERVDIENCEFFLAAHCDKSRKGKLHPTLGRGKCVALNQVFHGSFENIEEQLRDLTGESIDIMRKVIDHNSKMELDPLIYAPFSTMLCPRH